jgi:acyl-CoA synthetase (AMP-forming)/AMP-acid ligase II
LTLDAARRILAGMPMQSRYPKVQIPEVSMVRFLRSAIAAHGGRTALIDGPSGRSYTYQQLLDLSASVANALIARGLESGERVAFITPNLPEVAFAYHGVIAAGGVAMMLNPLSTADELKKYFAVGQPKMIVTVPPFVEVIRKADANVPIVTIGEAPPGTEPLTALLGASRTPPTVSILPDDIAVMPYSSGTTGFPKGVMLTHRNLIAQCLSLKGVSDAPIVVPNSHLIAVLPFFHIYGIVAFLSYGLMEGATIVTMPRFDLEQFLQLARRYELPTLHIVPPILLALTKYPGELQLPKLKNALVGAAPLGAGLAREFNQRSGALVSQVYGLTEVTGASHLASYARAREKPGSIGGIIANVEVKIVSTETGKEVADGGQGELWVRGPIVMKGYFENPQATAETVDKDGWLHTGDVGYADEDGDFFVVDRVKELIKYKGLQVAPAELEAVLLTHEAVADAAVFPQPDAEAGEIPKAAVVLKPGKTIAAEALMQYVQERVAPQKRVRALEFVAQIPKSASGKILRRLLK